MKEKEEILALDKKEKIAKKIFDKFIYIIEFILSAIFMIFFYKLICTKSLKDSSSFRSKINTLDTKEEVVNCLKEYFKEI